MMLRTAIRTTFLSHHIRRARPFPPHAGNDLLNVLQSNVGAVEFLLVDHDEIVVAEHGRYFF